MTIASRGVILDDHKPIAQAIATELRPGATATDVIAHCIEFYGEMILANLRRLKSGENLPMSPEQSLAAIKTESVSVMVQPVVISKIEPVDLSAPINF